MAIQTGFSISISEIEEMDNCLGFLDELCGQGS